VLFLDGFLKLVKEEERETRRYEVDKEMWFLNPYCCGD
jgi:hypothetical protein